MRTHMRNLTKATEGAERQRRKASQNPERGPTTSSQTMGMPRLSMSLGIPRCARDVLHQRQ
jgi:hypothetical protein